MKMPFGKFRGQSLDAIDTDYLLWLLDLADLRPGLRRAVEAELDARESWEAAPTNSGLPAAKLDRILQVWFRQLATKWHPDHHGGSNDGMAALNDTRDLLRSMLQGAA